MTNKFLFYVHHFFKNIAIKTSESKKNSFNYLIKWAELPNFPAIISTLTWACHWINLYTSLTCACISCYSLNRDIYFIRLEPPFLCFDMINHCDKAISTKFITTHSWSPYVNLALEPVVDNFTNDHSKVTIFWNSQENNTPLRYLY